MYEIYVHLGKISKLLETPKAQYTNSDMKISEGYA